MRDFEAAAAPRPGEEIDAARLGAWMREFAGSGEVTVLQFPAGHSNLTYLVTCGGQEYVLRRPPHGSTVKSAHDMSREYRVLRGLHAVYAPAPRAIAYCGDPEVLGAPFYLMERRHGIAIRKDLPAQISSDAATLRAVSESAIDCLAALHAVEPGAAGIADLGRPQGYAARQVDGWTRRWDDARTGPMPQLDGLAAWLRRNLPPESGRAAPVHNDYKLDNLLFDPADPSRVTAVLDWEMATLGDPLMDLGTTLAYWAEPDDVPEMLALRFSPTDTRGFLTRRELVRRYTERSRMEVGDVLYYYVFGLFKVAVIIQQIYCRYRLGLTQDSRFAGFGRVVEALALQGARAVRTGNIGV